MGSEFKAAIKLRFDDPPMDVAFNPAAAQVAVGLVTGDLLVHAYGLAEGTGSEREWTETKVYGVDAHPKSCRAVAYSTDGARLFSGSADESILEIDAGSGAAGQRRASGADAAVSRLMGWDANVVVAGDEGGGLRVWDSRMASAVASLDPHEDYVSDLTRNANENVLVATSGDGTFSVVDARKWRVMHRTEADADDELLSCVVLKGGRKVVCGCQSGVLHLYSWGAYHDCSDRYPGHPESVAAIVKYDEDTIFTGSEDGVIRILNVLPNKMIGVMGMHEDYPIERLAIAPDRALLASASHDHTVRLWDLAELQDDSDGDDDAGCDDGEDAVDVLAGREGDDNAESDEGGDDDNDSDDDSEDGGTGGDDEDDEEDSDDSDDSDARPKKRRKKPEKTKMRPGQGKPAKGAGGGNFFADLL